MTGLTLAFPSASSVPGVIEHDGAGAGFLASSAQAVPRATRPIQTVSHTHSLPGREGLEEEPHVRLPGVSVFGERFLVDRDPDLGVVLQHPKWSLLGYGQTIREAERLLLERAQELGAIMDDDFPLDLDDDGGRLRDFVIRLRYVRTIPVPR